MAVSELKLTLRAKLPWWWRIAGQWREASASMAAIRAEVLGSRPRMTGLGR